MNVLFETVRDLQSNRDTIARRRYGVIEIVESRLVGIHMRPLPKMISAVEAAWLGGWRHKRHCKNQCLLYYNQPLRHRSYLALKYVVSSFGCTWSTVRQGLVVLEEVARIKRSDAILCEATNHRISDRLFRRVGWEPHLQHRRGRHFIRRFYGEYPQEPRCRQPISATSPMEEASPAGR